MIAIIVALDTKIEEASYLKELIIRRGHSVLILNVGYGGDPDLKADVTVTELAELAGSDNYEINRLKRASERDALSKLMIKGAILKLGDLCKENKIDGILSIGGMSGAAMASSIMKEMPYRIPKLIFTSGAAMPQSYKFFGPSGVTVMQCLVEVGGLNHLLKEELNRAAGAICGMVDSVKYIERTKGIKPMIAMTTNSWCEKSAQYIQSALEDEYEVVRYHATGLQEVVMEKLIEDNYFVAVIDLVPSSITNAKFGGSRISWNKRLEVAGEKQIPQIIAPVLINVISRARNNSDELAKELEERKHYFIDENRVLLWLNYQEVKEMAPVYAEKLNKAKGPVVFMLPTKGWTSIETPESEFYDGEAMKGFTDALKNNLASEIEIIEVDANIDDLEFAKTVVAALKGYMLEKRLAGVEV